MLELYHHGSSACAAKVRFALAEKKLSWIGHYVDIQRGEQFAAEFRALNPKAVVPVLVHDGTVIPESTGWSRKDENRSAFGRSIATATARTQRVVAHLGEEKGSGPVGSKSGASARSEGGRLCMYTLMPADANNHAVREYLAVLDDAAFGAATPVVPKFLAPAEPASRQAASAVLAGRARGQGEAARRRRLQISCAQVRLRRLRL